MPLAYPLDCRRTTTVDQGTVFAWRLAMIRPLRKESPVSATSDLPDASGATRMLAFSEHPLQVWRAQYKAGRRSTALPYGLEALEQRGYVIEGQHTSTSRLGTKLRDVIEHRLGYPVESAVRAIPKATRTDVIIALLELQGVAPSLLRRRRAPGYASTPFVLWSCWLGDELRNVPRDEALARIRRFDGADLIVYLSQNQRDVFTDLGVAEERLFGMTWGVADDYYSPDDTPRDLDVVSVGLDRGRDYATLFRAVADTDMRVDVVCIPENLQGLDVPPNVTVHFRLAHDEYRRMLRRAKVVAVPSFEMTYPSGSSVALEASACGTCVVATATEPLGEYLTHDHNALLVNVGDAEQLRATLSATLADPALRERIGTAARRTVENRFNTRSMWFELDDVLRERGLLARRSS